MRSSAGRRRGPSSGGGRIEHLLRAAPVPEQMLGFAFPPLSQDGLRRRLGLAAPPREGWERLDEALRWVARLDREHPGWEDEAVRLVCSAAASDAKARKAASVLLSLRPVASPGPLVAVLSEAGGTNLEAGDCLLALTQTDTTETIALRHEMLERLCEPSDAGSASAGALFLCFVKCLQHRVLDERLFERALRRGAMGGEHDNGRTVRSLSFHPVLDYLGLTGSRYFRGMYDRAVEDVVFEPSLEGWRAVRGLRRFSGAHYLAAALRRLDEEWDDPSRESPAALHVARWTRDVDRNESGMVVAGERLRPCTLLLIGLVRRDLDRAVGIALNDGDHQAMMAWLRKGPFAAFEQALQDERPLRWCTKWCAALEQAVAMVGRLGLLESDDPMHLVRQGVAPDVPRIAANLAFVYALAGTARELIEERAREGSIAAALALGLVTTGLEEAAAVLVELGESGGLPQRRAAEKALQVACQGLGVSAQQVRAGLSVDAAWRDAGLEGALSRVWSDVAGWSVKLSVARGKPEVTAYGARGPARRLPREVRQHPKFEEIRRAKHELGQQHVRLKGLLEQAMVSQRPFAADEFFALCANGMFRLMAERLVLAAGGECRLGSEMMGADRRPVGIAHPARLLLDGTLASWQERLVHERIAQPFKQCFREVYVCEAEEADAKQCLRFDGRRAVARRAFALLRTRGWAPCDGCAVRDWPAQGVRARFVWACGVEKTGPYLMGSRQREPVSLGAIWFESLGLRGREPQDPQDPMPLGAVDPVVFSECVRDADLIAAKAGLGDEGLGSRETLALRASVVRLLVRELKLWHVAVSGDDTYALVGSGHGDFRVHLGTGSVFTEPEGRHVPVVAGLGASRDEMTLPFEAPDQETARVVAIILGLARATQPAEGRA